MSQPQSIASLEAQVVARRQRLASTVDELVATAAPAAILKRQVATAKARFADVAETPEGELRVERLAAVVVVVAVVGGVIVYRALRR